MISSQILDKLSGFCDEFLIHAVDAEGKCGGVEIELIEQLGAWTPLPTTYAGGVRNLDDLQLIREAGNDRLDVTIGSALDIFGGDSLSYREAVLYCRSARM